jgi:hypothetical protein
VAEPIAEQITENSVPKKRGRKPKNVTANPVTVGPGRPSLARNALVDDMVQPVLRRSERSKKISSIPVKKLVIFFVVGADRYLPSLVKKLENFLKFSLIKKIKSLYNLS